jgi:predicted transposase/invertase (TIGR01784 family)
MQTDSLFCQLFKCRPETLFELLGEPPLRAKSYRFDSVELKKSFRIDGLFLPRRHSMPVYFVEVQFHRLERLYANLFAKVFSYLNESRPGQDWRAVAIFLSRREEPRRHKPYDDLLASRRFTRIYLEELVVPADPPLGLGIVRLINAPEDETWKLAGPLMRKAKIEIPDPDLSDNVIQLITQVLCRRFTHMNRKEILDMLKLDDIRKSVAWQEALQEGREEGRQEGLDEGLLKAKQIAKKLVAEGRSLRDVAELLEISLSDARKWTTD